MQSWLGSNLQGWKVKFNSGLQEKKLLRMRAKTENHKGKGAPNNGGFVQTSGQTLKRLPHATSQFRPLRQRCDGKNVFCCVDKFPGTQQ